VHKLRTQIWMGTLAVLLSAPAWGHEGHGAEGAHAHGFDLLIGALGAVLAVCAVVWWRNKR
jgi:hypothetical protein